MIKNLNSEIRIPYFYYQAIILSLFGLTFLFSSCSRFNEAYHDRVRWGENSFVPSQAKEAFVELRCHKGLDPIDKQPSVAACKIVLKKVEGPSSPKVGELFSHYGAIPIFVKGSSPWDILYDDVKQILHDSGYEVDNGSEDSKVFLSADMKLLDVTSDPGGWLDLKGTTRATVSFTVSLRQNTDEPLWSKLFIGKHEIKVSYFFLSDAEKTLGEAYCRALDSFALTVNSEQFKHAMLLH